MLIVTRIPVVDGKFPLVTSSPERTDTPDPADEPVRVAARERPDLDVGEHDEERPARRLSRRVGLFVWVASVAIALLVLKQVFLPFAKGNQSPRVLSPGVPLPLAPLAPRPRGTAARDAAREDGANDNPGPLDWAFA